MRLYSLDLGEMSLGATAGAERRNRLDRKGLTSYKVGETNLQFTEPLDANSAMGKYLAREGPSVYHIAFGVDGIEEVAKGWAAKGNTWREAGGTGRSAEGYVTATLDPASSLGFPFQVAEG